MATVPSALTVAVGDKETAALWNGQVRDPINFWENPPRCFVTQTAGTSIANVTSTLVLFDTEVYDTDNLHSTASLTSRIVATTTGLYSVHAQVVIPANATGVRYAEIRKNAAGSNSGGTSINLSRQFSASASVPSIVALALDVQMTAGDYLELFAVQNSGGALVTTTGNNGTFFQARWVAAS